MTRDLGEEEIETFPSHIKFLRVLLKEIVEFVFYSHALVHRKELLKELGL